MKFSKVLIISLVLVGLALAGYRIQSGGDSAAVVYETPPVRVDVLQVMPGELSALEARLQSARERRKEAEAADRLRPVISTSLTTVLGLIPLASSDPQWYPLCMAIIFGLAASTVFAMVVVPALYLLLTSDVKMAGDSSEFKGSTALPEFQAG